MSKLSEKWEIRIDNERECWKLLKKNAIKTSEGVEDAWTADIFDLKDFNEFIRDFEE